MRLLTSAIAVPQTLSATELTAVSGGLSPLSIVAALVKGPPMRTVEPPTYDRDLEDLQVER